MTRCGSGTANCQFHFLSLQLKHLNIFIAMSTDWSVTFSEILNNHQHDYIDARGVPADRAQILKKCVEEIVESPLQKREAIELPENLGWVNSLFHGVPCTCTYY
jgi:hypothetical protein